nr:MAG TPA: hypothetical protein [Caudoviricetes sp.]
MQGNTLQTVARELAERLMLNIDSFIIFAFIVSVSFR